VLSGSYPIEIAKFFPTVKVYQEACPMWVPLIENNEHNSTGADYFVKKYLNRLLCRSEKIDTVLLACTHYPLLINKIREFLPAGTTVVSQGQIVADSLAAYLLRHSEIEERCNQGGEIRFYTTDSKDEFNKQAAVFFDKTVNSEHLDLSAL
jgi:glutamate racemase